MEEKKFFDKNGIKVTNSRFIVNGITYTMNGITSFECKEKESSYKFWSVIIGILGLLIFILPWIDKKDIAWIYTRGIDTIVIDVLAFVTGLILIYISYYLYKSNYYIFWDNASGNTNRLQVIKDRKRIISILKALNSAIVLRDGGIPGEYNQDIRITRCPKGQGQKGTNYYWFIGMIILLGTIYMIPLNNGDNHDRYNIIQTPVVQTPNSPITSVVQTPNSPITSVVQTPNSPSPTIKNLTYTSPTTSPTPTETIAPITPTPTETIAPITPTPTETITPTPTETITLITPTPT